MLAPAPIRTSQFRPFITPSRRPAPRSKEISDSHEPLAQAMQLMGPVMSYPRNTEIFGENEPAERRFHAKRGEIIVGDAANSENVSMAIGTQLHAPESLAEQIAKGRGLGAKFHELRIRETERAQR